MNYPIPFRSLFALLFLAGVAGACSPKAGPPPSAPPAEVSVITAKSESVTLTAELPGRITPMREAQVRARATGILLKRLFEEGSNVKEGDVLFQIDPAPLEASLASAEAALAKIEAALTESRTRVQRYSQLVDINAVSRQAYDEAVMAQAQNEAELMEAKAAVQTAKLNLGYATVEAPISGRIGRALVTEGALVSATEATQLAIIHQLDPVYLDITQSTTDVLRLRKAFHSGSLSGPAGEAEVTLILEEGSRYPHPGRMLFSDISVDPTTGMITLRTLVPNPDGLLMPGMFARGQVVQGVITNAVTIPQRTVSRGAGGTASVLVVDDQDTVQVRRIDINREIGAKVVVASGLQPGERIIVEGSQKAPPGSVVRTVPFEALQTAQAD